MPTFSSSASLLLSLLLLLQSCCRRDSQPYYCCSTVYLAFDYYCRTDLVYETVRSTVGPVAVYHCCVLLVTVGPITVSCSQETPPGTADLIKRYQSCPPTPCPHHCSSLPRHARGESPCGHWAEPSELSPMAGGSPPPLPDLFRLLR